MAEKYYKYTREITDIEVKDIVHHRFNDEQLKVEIFGDDNIAVLNATDDQVSEWLFVQNVELFELEAEKVTAYEQAKAKTVGVDYKGNLIPLDKDGQDIVVALAVKSMAGISEDTDIVCSNGTIMKLKADEIMPYVMWFSGERGKFFKGLV